MATTSKKDTRKIQGDFSPLMARSGRVAAMLDSVGLRGRQVKGTVVVSWGTNKIVFGLVDSLAGLGHDQLLSVSLWGHTLENVAPTRSQIEKAISSLARLAIAR